MIASHTVGAVMLILSWVSSSGTPLAYSELDQTFDSMEECSEFVDDLFAQLFKYNAAKPFMEQVEGAADVIGTCVVQAHPV